MRARPVLAAVIVAVCASRALGSAQERRPAALGLALNLPSGTAPAARTRAVEQARSTGVTMFALTVSWSDVEQAPRQYRIDEVTRTARLLRQSGAVLHLDLALVTAATRDVPSDLKELAFDDPRLTIRLGRFLEALQPALLDFATLSLGHEADSYFSERPGELAAYRRLLQGSVEFLRKRAPHLRVGVTTLAPLESRAPEIAAALHAGSSVLFYIYAPIVPGSPFLHRPPQELERDWKRLLEGSRGRPIAFPEVSYSSAEENGSTPARQAEFVSRLRRAVTGADGTRLLFARYVPLRDPAASEVPPTSGLSESARRRTIFLAHRGLQLSDGRPKPAWREWVRGAPPAPADKMPR